MRVRALRSGARSCADRSVVTASRLAFAAAFAGTEPQAAANTNATANQKPARMLAIPLSPMAGILRQAEAQNKPTRPFCYSRRMAETHGRHEREETERQEALQTLETLRKPPRLADSSLANAARRAVDHFSGKDAIGDAEGGGTDPIELWGRRIGRTLSLIAFTGLAIYLYVYFFHR